MNESAMHQSRFERIEAFLLGDLKGTDRERFEGEMDKDADLRAEVELQRENMLAVELGGVERAMRKIMQQDRPQGRGWGQYLKYAAAAAAVAVLLLGALWWLGRPPLNERLYAEYHVADPGLPVPMSATRNPAFQDAMVAYKLGDYAEAGRKWGALLADSPGNDTLLYYIASASLAKGDAKAAIPLLERVAGNGASGFHERARWFLFLAYLHEGRLADMRAMGMSNDPQYGERARQIEAELMP